MLSAHGNDKCACWDQMDQSVLCFGKGTPVPYPNISVDIRVLLLEPYHTRDSIIVGNVGNDVVNCMALLHSGVPTHLYHLPYNCSSAQRFTTDRGDRQRHLLPVPLSPCLNRLQSELICNVLENGVVGGAQVDKGSVGIITIAARAFAEVHWYYEVQ
jgi:hypothetical protein